MVERFDVEGVRAVVAQLEEMQANADRRPPLYRHDGVACFTYLYTEITRNVLRCVESHALEAGDPAFDDPQFMACLDVAFANRYFAAMEEGPAPAFRPRCWQALIAHRENRDISPLGFAVAGVNAHVNFDLPFALLAAAREMGCDLESGSNHADYQLINDIFAKHMQQLRQHFENHFERGFDRALVSRVENAAGDLTVILARDLAWMKAVELWPFRDDPVALLRLEKSRDRWVARSNEALFRLDRLPGLAWRSMHLVPGPTRAIARRGLGRTGWGAHHPHQDHRGQPRRGLAALGVAAAPHQPPDAAHHGHDHGHVE